MQFSIKPFEKGLCRTCRNALVVTDDKGDTMITCHVVGEPITIKRIVVRCSDYDEVGRLQLYEMRQVAWRLELNKKTHEIGFRPPKPLKYMDDEENDEG